MKHTKRYFYIKANPKEITNIDYNNLVRSLPLPLNLFVIDWVHNVTGREVKKDKVVKVRYEDIQHLELIRL